LISAKAFLIPGLASEKNERLGPLIKMSSRAHMNLTKFNSAQ